MKKSQDPAFKALIMDHYKQPRFFGKPAEPLHTAEEHNRTCGDRIELFLSQGSGPGQARFQFAGAGCSLCIASASMMSSLLQDVSVVEARRCWQQFQDVAQQGLKGAEADSLWHIYDGLRDYPVRARCVRLPWQALEKILSTWEKEVQG